MTTFAILRALARSTGLAAVALSTAACGSTSGALDPSGSFASTATSTTPSPEASTATSPVPVVEPEVRTQAPTASDADVPANAAPAAGASSQLLDGTRRVDVQTYTGRWVVPAVEGGLAATEQPSRSELPSSWVITPVSEAGGQHLIVTVATTDGKPSCLRVVDAATVALATCDPTDPAQLMSVAALDSPDQVNITNSLGTLVARTDGRLVVAADPGEPNSVFTLVERGVSTRS